METSGERAEEEPAEEEPVWEEVVECGACVDGRLNALNMVGWRGGGLIRCRGREWSTQGEWSTLGVKGEREREREGIGCGRWDWRFK